MEGKRINGAGLATAQALLDRHREAIPTGLGLERLAAFHGAGLIAGEAKGRTLWLAEGSFLDLLAYLNQWKNPEPCGELRGSGPPSYAK